MDLQAQLRKNIAKLMSDMGLNNVALSQILDINPSQVGRIFSGEGNFTLRHIENLAAHFDIRAIDLFTYPDVYVKPGEDTDTTEVLIRLRLSKEKREQVMKLVLAENDIEVTSPSPNVPKPS